VIVSWKTIHWRGGDAVREVRQAQRPGVRKEEALAVSGAWRIVPKGASSSQRNPS